MVNMNSLQMLMQLKNTDPRTAAMQIIQNNYGNDPRVQSLVQMANSGDINSLQKIASQILGPSKNLSAEIQNLLQMVQNL